MNVSRYGWYAGLFGILLIGFVIYATGYNRGFPLYEEFDEARNLEEVYILRGLDDKPLQKPGYPPGILYVNYAAQRVAESITGESAWDCGCTVIGIVRLIGIAAVLTSGLMMALLGRKLGGDLAGLIAPLAWYVAPRVLERAQFGYPQVYESLFYLLALYAAILAVERRQARFAIFSVLAGLGAVLFKYPTFPVLALAVGATLWNLRTERGRWLRVLALQLTLIALTAIALFTLGSANSLVAAGHAEATQFTHQGLKGLFNVGVEIWFLVNASGQIGLGIGVLLVLAVLGTIAYWPRALTWQRLGWLGLLALTASHLIVMTTYMVFVDDPHRHVLSVSGLLAVTVAVSLVAIVRQLGRWLKPRPLAYVPGALFVVLWLVPQFNETRSMIQYRTLPVTYGAMLPWLDQELPGERLLVADARPFTHNWSCYPVSGRTVSDTAKLMDRPLDTWLADGLHYVQLVESDMLKMSASPEGQAYLDRLSLLKRFPEPGTDQDWRTWRLGYEPQFAFYQLMPSQPETQMDAVFGQTIRLLGYNINSEVFTPGSRIEIIPYWQPVQQPTHDYNLFVHLAPRDSIEPVLAQLDDPPTLPTRPTNTWTLDDKLIVGRTFGFDIPADLPPGAYQLNLGLYDWQTGERLLTADGQDHVSIAIQVALDSTQTSSSGSATRGNGTQG